MKDYYEILEVNQKASQETINKVYKTLVKKYHPDTKKGLEKTEAEEKIKLINEAYDILSNEFKRSEYDNSLNSSNSSNDELIAKYEELYNENQILKVQLQNYKDTFDKINNISSSEDYKKRYYYNPKTTINNKSFRNMLKEKFEGLIAIVLTCCIFIFAFWVLWSIPFTHDLLKNTPLFELITNILDFNN